MQPRKQTLKYYFLCEGYTEEWYLEKLEKLINNHPNSKFNVSFRCKVKQRPLKFAKSLVVTQPAKIIHIFDYESDEEKDVNHFKSTLDEMKKAASIGKQISYTLAYSNLTFELWLILHKKDCNRSLVHREHYLDPINSAFKENFTSIRELKVEQNFKRVLKRLTLENVIDAVKRAEQITAINKSNGDKLEKYKGYKFYRENPSLSIGEEVGQILKDCCLIKKQTKT